MRLSVIERTRRKAENVEPVARIAGAMLALALEDLGSAEYRADALIFLYSEQGELCAGILGINLFELRRKVKRYRRRRF